MSRDPAYVLEEILKKLEQKGGVALQVNEGSFSEVSTANSTTTTLLASATYTGSAEEVSKYSTVTCVVDSDVDGTLRMELSQDGENWDRAKVVPVDITIGSGSVHTLEVVSRYYRVVYVNGSANQAHLRIQTLFHKYKSGFLTSSPDQLISKIDDVQLTRSVNDPFVDYSRGLFSDKYVIHKFGANESSPSGTERDVWAYGATTEGNINYPWPTVIDTLDVVSSSINDDVGGTGAITLTIQGLDEAWAVQTETITLDGTTPVTTAGSFCRVFRAFIADVGTYTGSNIGDITITTTAGGDVLCFVEAGIGQSHLSMYTVPAGHTAYLRHAHAVVAVGTNKDATVKMWRRMQAINTSAPFTAGGKRIVHTWPSIQGVVNLDFYAMPSFLEYTDVWFTALGSANTFVTVVYDLLVVKGDNPTNPQ